MWFEKRKEETKMKRITYKQIVNYFVEVVVENKELNSAPEDDSIHCLIAGLEQDICDALEVLAKKESTK